MVDTSRLRNQLGTSDVTNVVRSLVADVNYHCFISGQHILQLGDGNAASAVGGRRSSLHRSHRRSPGVPPLGGIAGCQNTKAKNRDSKKGNKKTHLWTSKRKNNAR